MISAFIAVLWFVLFLKADSESSTVAWWLPYAISAIALVIMVMVNA